jgi:hypothetical protein
LALRARTGSSWARASAIAGQDETRLRTHRRLSRPERAPCRLTAP